MTSAKANTRNGKAELNTSFDSDDVLLKVSLLKYVVDSKNVTFAEIINICKMGQ